MRFFQQQKLGMSLVQTLVILGIIAILSTVILASISDAKKKARDKERVSDLQGIQLALRLYKDTEGAYPTEYDSFTDGIVIGDGGDIDEKLRPFFPVIPKDKMQEAMLIKYGVVSEAYAMAMAGPSGTSGADVTYGYVYDSYYDNCTVSGATGPRKVLYAKTMELSASSNWAKVCGGPLPGTNSYIIILK